MPYSGEIVAAIVIAVVLQAGIGAVAHKLGHGARRTGHAIVRVFTK